MKNINWIIGIVTVLLLIGGVFAFSKNGSSSSPSPTPFVSPTPDSYIYFWGDGCPHCKIVADFIESWDKKDKVKIEKLEVWGSKDNANLMMGYAQGCNIQKSELAVPMLVSPDKKCFKGDTEIINLLKSL